MIVDGRALAVTVKKDLQSALKTTDQILRLAVIWVGDDLVSAKYIDRKNKLGEEIGVEVVVYQFADTIESLDLEKEIIKLNNDNRINGILVQLPLPKHIDQARILNLISPDKDVDALGQEAKVLSPVVEALKKIIETYKISLIGKNIVVLGQGNLVGRPVVIWLVQTGLPVSVVDLKTSNAEEKLMQADIIISGVGQPNLLTPEKIKEGVVLIDAGTSELNGHFVGDAHPDCASKCAFFTPVPGGIGPLTVVMLFKNLLALSDFKINCKT